MTCSCGKIMTSESARKMSVVTGKSTSGIKEKQQTTKPMVNTVEFFYC